MILQMSAASYHLYYTMHSDGSITKTESALGSEYDLQVIDCIISYNDYISTTIILTGPDANYEAYRLHADGEHYTSDETNPLWNMKLQQTINPEWCSYSYEVVDEIATLKFTDTFDATILTKENPTANTLKYIIYDRTHDSTFAIWINQAIYYATQTDIITGVENVYNDNDDMIYYNLQGHSSNHPFIGINIVKNNGKYEKRILKY